MKVSWQVTGIRNDAFAKAAGFEVERDKPDEDRGRYLHPEAFGQGLEQAVDYRYHEEALEEAERLARGEDPRVSPSEQDKD